MSRPTSDKAVIEKVAKSTEETKEIKDLLNDLTVEGGLSEDVEKAVSKVIDDFQKEYLRLIAKKEAATS